MEIALIWVRLAASAAVILVASQYLAKSSDVIAEKTGLGRSFVGVVLLATATSLPELGTGVSSVVLVDSPDLAAGDAFGSNLFNLLIMGVLDIVWRNGPILTAVSMTSVLVAALGLGAIGLATMAVLVHGETSWLSAWPLSPLSLVLLILFAVAMYLIYRHSETGHATEVEKQYGESSLTRAVGVYAVSAAVVVGAAVLLAGTGDLLAKEMGWEASFVGTQFLALSTSLPELATSLAALRLKAPELAITNLLGSNLFNMGLVLFVDDVAYTEGVLWSGVSQVHSLTGVLAILMTCIVVVALVTRPRGRPGRFWTPEAVALAAMYVIASVVVFQLG